MSKKIDLSNSYRVEVRVAYDRWIKLNNVVSIELEDIAKPIFKVNKDGVQYTAGYKKLKFTIQKTTDPANNANTSTEVKEIKLTPEAVITLYSENEGKEESVEDLKSLLASISELID